MPRTGGLTGVTANDSEVSFRGDENVLKLIECGTGRTILRLY